MDMRHGDAFAGIGGFGLAARSVGWSTVWAAELEESARVVYADRCGHAGLRFDRDIRESRDLPAIDILTGGFPCQDLSVAGRRRGLAGARSGLFFELVRLLSESRPEWFVFENVPGLLSSHGGRDMETVLDSLVECGYGVAYRVLNAQFFGVAQRRRRVFFVGHSSGEWERAAAVLFERECGERNLEASLSERESVTGDVAACLNSGGNEGGFRTEPGEHIICIQDVRGSTRHKKQHGIGIRDDGKSYTLGVTEQHGIFQQDIAQCITSHEAKHGGDPSADNYIVANAVSRSAGHHGHSSPRGDGSDNLVIAAPLSAGGHPNSNMPGRRKEDDINLVVAENQRGELRTMREVPALGAGGGKPGSGYPAILSPSFAPDRVRTPSGISSPLDLCEIDIEKGSDSPRYKGIGNAIAVPCAVWIFKRINEACR